MTVYYHLTVILPIDNQLQYRLLRSRITDSVFNSLNMDSMKQALGSYCLDEGRGIYNANRPLNKEVANDDVARSKDTTLQAAIESQTQTQKVSAGIKI